MIHCLGSTEAMTQLEGSCKFCAGRSFSAAERGVKTSLRSLKEARLPRLEWRSTPRPKQQGDGSAAAPDLQKLIPPADCYLLVIKLKHLQRDKTHAHAHTHKRTQAHTNKDARRRSADKWLSQLKSLRVNQGDMSRCHRGSGGGGYFVVFFILFFLNFTQANQPRVRSAFPPTSFSPSPCRQYSSFLGKSFLGTRVAGRAERIPRLDSPADFLHVVVIRSLNENAHVCDGTGSMGVCV